MIVADTNLVAYLVIDGDRTGAARRVWGLDPDWRLPPLWRAELLNVLATTVRAGLLTSAQAHQCWGAASDLFRDAEVEPGGAAVLDVAVNRRVSAYDAQFVAVAESLGVRLVSGDRALVSACPERAVLIEDFAPAAQGSGPPPGAP